jgi:hypothetical protein
MQIKLLGIFVLITTFFACTTDESPRPVAENFLAAMSERNYDEASKYATVETQKLLKQLEKIEMLSGTSDDLKPGKINVILEEIAGSKAIVYFKEEGNELEQKITLKKVIGDDNKKVWKVALKKEEIKLNRDSGIDLSIPKEDTPKIPS